jgi:hypothetical protein
MRVLRTNQHKIEPKRSKNSAFCGNEVKASELIGEGQQVTNCRLHEFALCMPSAEGCQETALACFTPRRKARQGRQAKKRPLVHADESPRHVRECREGRGFSPSMESCLLLGALAPEATWLQGLKAQLVELLRAAGLKPRPSNVPR